jgi:hypothetical protein
MVWPWGRHAKFSMNEEAITIMMMIIIKVNEYAGWYTFDKLE